MIEFWDNIASKEEVDIDDEYVNRQLRWREIERNLDGVETILDIGAATGVFSIPLAKKGYNVTHLDFSNKMIEIAKGKAKGLKNISYVVADASDLSSFQDRQFDLVLNLDGAISFSGKNSAKVISESCRVTRKKLLASASNKGCMIATWLNYSLNSFESITPSVYEMMKNGFWNREQFEENKNIAAQYFNFDSFKAYNPDELREEIEKHNLSVKFSRSIGSLTHLYLVHLFRQKPNEIQSKNFPISEEFIDMCEKFDQDIMPNGPGSFRRAGVLTLAEVNA